MTIREPHYVTIAQETSFLVSNATVVLPVSILFKMENPITKSALSLGFVPNATKMSKMLLQMLLENIGTRLVSHASHAVHLLEERLLTKTVILCARIVPTRA